MKIPPLFSIAEFMFEVTKWNRKIFDVVVVVNKSISDIVKLIILIPIE